MSSFVRGKLPLTIKYNFIPWACGAAVAQRTHNPLVAGSNPAGPIFSFNLSKQEELNLK